MNAYASGARFEHRIMAYLEASGWFALRYAGSHSPVDVVGIRDGTAVLIQCRRNGRLDPRDWNELFELAERLGVVAILARAPNPRRVEYLRLNAPKDRHSTRPQPYVALDSFPQVVPTWLPFQPTSADERATLELSEALLIHGR